MSSRAAITILGVAGLCCWVNTTASAQDYSPNSQNPAPAYDTTNPQGYKPIEDLSDISFLEGRWCHKNLKDLKSEFSMVRENSFRHTVIAKTASFGYPYIRQAGDVKAPRFVDPSQPKRFIVLELVAGEVHANISGNREVLVKCKE